MDVICSTSFGIEVDSQRNPDNPFIKHSKEFLDVEVAGNPLFLVSCEFVLLYRSTIVSIYHLINSMRTHYERAQGSLIVCF